MRTETCPFGADGPRYFDVSSAGRELVVLETTKPSTSHSIASAAMRCLLSRVMSGPGRPTRERPEGQQRGTPHRQGRKHCRKKETAWQRFQANETMRRTMKHTHEKGVVARVASLVHRASGEAWACAPQEDGPSRASPVERGPAARRRPGSELRSACVGTSCSPCASEAAREWSNEHEVGP